MGKRVLIVADNMRSRLELRDLLLTHGLSVVGEATSGRQALELFEKVTPDLTIVDAKMRDMDGVTTIRQLHYKYQDAVIVLSAGSGEKRSALEALSVGAIDFITRPYIPRNVMRTLRRAMSGTAPM